MASAQVKIQDLKNGINACGVCTDAKSCMPMPECLVRDCIALCENLLAGTIVGEKVENPFCGECRLARNNTMQIVYRDDQVK